MLAIEVTGAVTDAGREKQILLGAVTGVVVVRRVVAIVVTGVLTVVVRGVVEIVVTGVLTVVVIGVVAIVVTRILTVVVVRRVVAIVVT